MSATNSTTSSTTSPTPCATSASNPAKAEIIHFSIMSEETPPYQVQGDEALEARIVAWVLGESSPFEIEELKRLCDERPELEIFRRRIDAVHGLLSESEKQGASPAWKLPPSKRAALDAALGAPATAPGNVIVRKKRIHRMWISAAASVALLLAVGSLFSSRVMMKRSRSPEIASANEARMKLLETEYPDELIQGTPVPITPESLLSDQRSEARPSRKPSSPSSAQAEAIASTTASPAQIPVPQAQPQESSIAFGDSDAFGGGWGGGELAENQVPLVGDIPATGRLFAGEPAFAMRGESGTDIEHDISIGYSSEYAIRGAGLNADGAMPADQSEVRDRLAQAGELRRTGKIDEAREILEPLALTDGNARSELEAIDDPIRTNPAVTYEHTQNIDQVRRSLYLAEGNYNLGKFDDARKAYEETLRIDPYNQAARRGMERIAARKSDYYRAAYDHTRAELLMEVDRAWELAVPAEGQALDQSDQSDQSTPPDPLAELTLPELVTRINALRKAIEDPSISDSRKQSQFDELQRLQQLAIKKSKAAQPPPLVPENETSAAADPFSTFSLHVSDAAFVISRDALRRGERPAAQQIRVEQFYNALDYGDPAPTAGEAVATHIEQTAHPVIPGRNLVRIAARVGSTGRAASQPLHLTLLVDQSGSMIRADRRAAMENALNTLTGLLGENDRVHLIGFARQPRLIAEALPGNRANEILALIHQAAAEGGTNMEAALELAQQIAARHHNPGAQNRVVVLSDGAVNLGDADPARLAERITAMRQQGIATDIAGIGSDGLNDALLAELARHGDGRYHVVTPETGDRLARDLAGAFRPAASDVKVQVVFNPERVGGWKLIGFEEHRLNTEDFRNDAVDAAELAAEEAGVAIYQVETLPQGRGQIGEIFIRFRDTDTGQIVERSWPIPYQPNTPALDQARPSMQLATLAMLTAEKLRGGPLGDAIDLSTHRSLIESLRPHFRHDPRANELFEMISTLTGR